MNIGLLGDPERLGKNQWVVPYGDGWAVRGEGNERVTAVFKTQAEAEKFAETIADNKSGELIIQSRQSKIRSKDSHGNDPFPPRDNEH